MVELYIFYKSIIYMPYNIRKLPNQDLYRVYNKDTKSVHSYSTTLENAKKQVALLEGIKEGNGIDNPDLYEKAKQIADATYSKPSGYKSGFIVKKYKEMGGTYSGKKDNKGIGRWFKEDWKDIGGKDYPVYRPTIRITKDTPLTATEIKPSNLKKQIALKQVIRGDANLPPFEGGAISKSEKIKLTKEIKSISEEEAKESYLDLADEKTIPPSTSTKGNKFVDYFTFNERLETTGNKGLSFWDFWENKSEYMKKTYVKNILNYYKKQGTNANSNPVKNLYKIFKLYFGSVGIFKPVIAMSIYHRFKPTSILDFTMGWGGRLVGAAALDIPKYIGIDLNKNLEKPYREMEKTLKELGTSTDIKLIFQDALKVDYSKLDYDMVFTSPPYYNKEIYSGTDKMTEEEWNEKFYRPIFAKTWKYLKNGGHYILNVPIAVYDNVLVDLLGKADIFIPMNTKRAMSNKLKQAEYKEYIYVWVKKEKQGGLIRANSSMEDLIYNLTPVEKKGNNWIKRDDMFEYAGQKGGKARAALYLITNGTKPKSITTAGNRNSPQINIISSIGKKLGIPVTAFTSTGELGNEVKIAKTKGADIKQVMYGYENVISSNAKKYSEKNNSLLIPFGMDTEEVHPLTARQVKNIPKDVKRIVVPVGSASSIIGIVKGVKEYRPDIKILGVVVGANPLRKLNKYVPDWKKYAKLQRLSIPYQQPATITNFKGIELDPYYEAKTIPYIKDNDLLWIVGVREGLKLGGSIGTDFFEGGSIGTDLFETDGVVSIPEFRSISITLPTYMFKRLPDMKGKPPPYRYRLVIPITKSRNISSRKLQTSLDITQKAVDRPIADVDEIPDEEKPRLEDFSPDDRDKIKTYYENIKTAEKKKLTPDDIDKDKYDIKQRGLPCYLYENCRKQGLRFKENEKQPKKKKEPKEKMGRIRPTPTDYESGSKKNRYYDRGIKEMDLFAALVRKSKETDSDYSEPSDKSFKSKTSTRISKDIVPIRRRGAIDAPSKKKGSVVAERVANIEKKVAKAAEKKRPVGRPKKQKKRVVLVEDSDEKDYESSIEEDDEEENDYSGNGLENKILGNNKMPNKWITYVKQYASKNGISYSDALKDPKCKAGYKTGSGINKTFHTQDLVAESYNDSELGANAGKKYISL